MFLLQDMREDAPYRLDAGLMDAEITLNQILLELSATPGNSQKPENWWRGQVSSNKSYSWPDGGLIVPVTVEVTWILNLAIASGTENEQFYSSAFRNTHANPSANTFKECSF